MNATHRNGDSLPDGPRQTLFLGDTRRALSSCHNARVQVVRTCSEHNQMGRIARMAMGATYEVHERSMSSHAPSVALLAGKAWATVAQKMKTRYVATVRMLAVIIDNICRAAVLRTSSRLVRWNAMGVDHVSAALELYLSCGQRATGHGHNARTISQADAEMRLPARSQEGYTVKSRTRVTEGNRQSTKKADADRTCHVYAS